MDVLMEIESKDLEGVMGREFIERGICPDLSLGYHVTMSKSPAGFLRATNKKVVELSIVRQGARDCCKIRGFSDGAVKSADAALNSQLFGGGGSKNSEPAQRHRILA